MNQPIWETLAWPIERLHECLAALIGKAGLSTAHTEIPASVLTDSDVARWIEQSAKHFHCEVEPASVGFREVPEYLTSAAPAILLVEPGLYLAIVQTRRGYLHVLTPEFGIRTMSIDDVYRALRQPYEVESEDANGLLDRAGVKGKRRLACLDLLLEQQLRPQRFAGCWVIRQASGVGFGAWLRQSGAIRNGSFLLAAHTVQYLVWLLSWALLGSLSLAGHLDRGWILGWSLMLATIVPCRVLSTWLQGCVAIGIGGHLKRRLLDGALRLEPEEVRHLGIGNFLAQSFEAEALESLATGGGIAGVLAICDLVVSGFVLGKLAILLVIWCGAALISAILFFKRFDEWSGRRLSMTQDLVESMVGRRTRVAQQSQAQWHSAEDAALDHYLGSSFRIDRVGAVLISFLPRGWLVAGLACLAPAVMSGQSASQTAVALGGILLAYTAFDRLTSSFSEITAAGVAWKRVSPLFKAAARPELLGRVLSRGSSTDIPVLEADGLAFRYAKQTEPVLKDCSLTVREGERILLEGGSGGGKTTFASLLSGTRKPEAGLLLSRGLDIHTLGTKGWRERVVSAPQFHENHILTETLAFNLLFGKRWPPAPSDFEEAEEVCRNLGLGPLLDRMPSGLLQMVGEGGWQLSHGERSRIFIARALLQNPDLMILDESFGTLDPENLQLALRYTLDKAKTLMVIAHP